MNRKKRNLVLLLAATAALGALLWLLAIGDKGVDVTPDNSVTESDHDHEHEHETYGTLLDYSADDLKTVVFKNAKAKYTAYLDPKSGSVAFKELEGFPVNTNFIETIWYGAVQMIYQDIVGSTKEKDYKPKDYGFDKPSLTVKVTLKNGGTYTFRAGKHTPGYDEDVYYLTLSGDANIYACSLETAFFMGDNYYLSDDIFGEYDTEKDGGKKSDIKIGDITLTGEAFPKPFQMKVSTTADASDITYGYGYIVTSPIQWQVKPSAASALLEDLKYLMAEDVAVLNPTAKQKKAYGLATPYLTVAFRRNGRNVVMIASKPKNEKMYVMLKNHKIIYELNVNSLAILHQLTPETLYSINAVSASLNALSGVTISGGGVKCDISVRREENTNTAAASDPIYIYSVTEKGSEKKYAAYTKLIKQLNGSAIRRWNVKTPTGKPDITITLSYFDEFQRKPTGIRLYKVTDREYAVVREGCPTNTVTETWVRQLLNDTKEFMA